MKSRKQKTLKRESLQSRVKHGLSLTKKKSMQETNRESDQHLFFIERVRFESCV